MSFVDKHSILDSMFSGWRGSVLGRRIGCAGANKVKLVTFRVDIHLVRDNQTASDLEFAGTA
jgi:hypothetical protein